MRVESRSIDSRMVRIFFTADGFGTSVYTLEPHTLPYHNSNNAINDYDSLFFPTSASCD